VCSPKGFLFSREAILENLLEQKKSNKRKLAAWQAQQADDARKQVRMLQCADSSTKFVHVHQSSSSLLYAKLRLIAATCLPVPACLPSPLQDDKAAIDAEAALLAFDRQNHMGASEELTRKLRKTINEEADALLSDTHRAAGTVNIATNREQMKVWHNLWCVVCVCVVCQRSGNNGRE
jgi:nitric oxide synthase-interacting protein